MARDRKPNSDDRDERDVERDDPLDRTEMDEEVKERPNPPRTTTGVWTSPKFGSAGSGGAELEPGPEKN